MTMTSDTETERGEVSEGEAAVFAVQRLAQRLKDAAASSPARQLLVAVDELLATRRLLTEACGMLKVLDRHAPHAAVDEFLARVAAALAHAQPPSTDAVDPSAADPGTPTPRA